MVEILSNLTFCQHGLFCIFSLVSMSLVGMISGTWPVGSTDLSTFPEDLRVSSLTSEALLGCDKGWLGLREEGYQELSCYCAVVAKITRISCDYEVSDQRILRTCAGLQPLFHVALMGYPSGMSPRERGLCILGIIRNYRLGFSSSGKMLSKDGSVCRKVQITVNTARARSNDSFYWTVVFPHRSIFSFYTLPLA